MCTTCNYLTMHRMSKHKQDYHTIRGISYITADKFVKYVDVTGSEAASSSSDIITFWKRAPMLKNC